MMHGLGTAALSNRPKAKLEEQEMKMLRSSLEVKVEQFEGKVREMVSCYCKILRYFL